MKRSNLDSWAGLLNYLKLYCNAKRGLIPCCLLSDYIWDRFINLLREWESLDEPLKSHKWH